MGNVKKGEWQIHCALQLQTAFFAELGLMVQGATISRLAGEGTGERRVSKVWVTRVVTGKQEQEKQPSKNHFQGFLVGA
jgi:hypothetical protein